MTLPRNSILGTYTKPLFLEGFQCIWMMLPRTSTLGIWFKTWSVQEFHSILMMRIHFIASPEAGFIQSDAKIVIFTNLSKVPNPFPCISRNWIHTKLCKKRVFYRSPNLFHCTSRGWIYTRWCKNGDFYKNSESISLYFQSSIRT